MPVSAAAGTIIGSAYAETSFHGDAVADVAALTAIVASNRFDRQERTVETPLNQYVFDEQSAAADNPPDILEPDDSPATGRWIRLVPGGGVPLAHAVSHSDGGSDEITVEDLATSEVSTTKALMSDGAGGLVFGAPVAAAHALGGAVHTSDTLSNLNTKVSDAVLVDADDIVLTDGTNPLTGAWGVGGFDITGLADLVPDGDGTRSVGSASAALGTVWVRILRPDSGQALTLMNGSGEVAINTNFENLTFNDGGLDMDVRIEGQTDENLGFFDASTDRVGIGTNAPGTLLDVNGVLTVRGDILFDGDGTRSVGSATETLSKVWVRTFEPDAGQSLTFNQAGGTARFQLLSSGFVIVNGPMRHNDNQQDAYGSTDDFIFRYDTTSQTNNTLLFGTEGAEGNTVVFTHKSRLTVDHAVGTPGTPTWRYHDGSATLTNFGSVTHDGTDFVFTANAGNISLVADVLVTGDILSDGNNTRSIGSTSAQFGTIWVGLIRPNPAFNLAIQDGVGGNAITVRQAATVFNESGLDKDTRIEGENDINLGFFDADTDRFGVGTATPGTKLDVNGVLTVRGDILFDGNGTRTIGATGAALNTVFTRKLRADATASLQFFTGAGVLAGELTNTLGWVYNENGSATIDMRYESDDDPDNFTIDAGLNCVGVGVALNSGAGKLHVFQNVSDDAIPVLVLEQADIDDTFVNFIGTSAADGTRSISSDTTEDGAKFGAYRVEINGVVKWVRVYDDES